MHFVHISVFLSFTKQAVVMLQNSTTHDLYPVHVKKLASPLEIYLWNGFTCSWSPQLLMQREIWGDFFNQVTQKGLKTVLVVYSGLLFLSET